MENTANDLFEKATVLGLVVPAAGIVGSKAASLGKPNSYETEKDYRDRIRGKNYIELDPEDKVEELKRSIKPSGSEGNPKNPKPVYKKGGKVSSASKRADGCITKGHTKGRFV